MLFEEGDAALLKKWIVKRLEDISDADSDVLADYVLALLRHEQGEAEVKKLCIDQLDDFLREHTVGFVDDVFVALKAKSFLSVNSTLSGSAAVLNLSVPQQQTPPPAQVLPKPNEPAQDADGGDDMSTTAHRGGQQSSVRSVESTVYQPREDDRGGRSGNERGQKRSYYDRDRDGGRDSQYGPNSTSSRGFKAPRRGGNDRGGRWGGRGDMGAGRGGNGRDMTGSQQLQHPQVPFPVPFPNTNLIGAPPPIIPPGFPWPDETMATLLAMQAAASGWAGMAGFPAVPAPATSQQRNPLSATVPSPADAQRKPVEKKVGERCKDYDEKGYCMQGDMCPYEHGVDHIVIAGQEGALDEYDPHNSTLFPVPIPTSSGGTPGTNGSTEGRGGYTNDRGRGRGGRGGRGGGTGRGGRSEISSTGPNYDKSNTTLVVEHIPEDKLNEASIKEFFSQFGTIFEVAIQASKKLATIKFEKWDMAKKAYDSPAPIFDNRFVKVFWFKADTNTPAPTRGGHHPSPAPSRHRGSPPPQLSKLADEGEIDMEEFKRKTEEAQKTYEAKMAKKKAHEEALKELERKKEELLKMEQEQKRILMEKLAKRKANIASKGTSPSPATPTGTAAASPSPSANGAAANTASPTATTSTTEQKPVADAETEALRKQLEALEAEAKSLGIDHAGTEDPTQGSYRGRGGFRGRGAPRVFRGASRGGYHSASPYVPPGAGKPYTPPYRGRGRGGPVALGAMRLDNRTRKVAIGGVDGDEEKNEMLRQYLLGVGEFESIEPHPEKEGMQVVTFKDRLTAEKFVHAGSYIPDIGKVELAWVNNPLPSANTASTSMIASTTTTTTSTKTEDNSTKVMETRPVAPPAMEDYDLAEDDESRWLAE